MLIYANLSWHHKFFHFHCLFESRKSGKEGKKIQRSEYLENAKSLLEIFTLSDKKTLKNHQK